VKYKENTGIYLKKSKEIKSKNGRK